MRSIFERVRRTSSGLRRMRGAGAIEYALLLGLIGLVAIGAVAATGGEITRILCAAGNFVGRDTCGTPAGGPGNGEADPEGPNTPPEIATADLPMGHVGRAYAFPIVVTDHDGDRLAILVSGGGLPSGLSLSPIGTIFGVPTVAGSYVVEIAVRDEDGYEARKSFTIDINTPPLWLSSEVELKTPLDEYYEQTLQASDADGDAVHFEIAGGALPEGMSLDPSGLLSGTPTAAGTFTFTVNVIDTHGAETPQGFSLDVSSPPVWVTPAGALQIGVLGDEYAVQLRAEDPDNDTLNFNLAAGSLPYGLALSQQGVISGTPMVAGLSSFDVRVFDGRGQEAIRSFAIEVNRPPVWVTPAGVIALAPLGESFGPFQLEATDPDGDTLSYDMVKGQLPDGITMTAGALLQGTPTKAGRYTFDVMVSDGKGGEAMQCFTLDVTTAPQWTPLEITEPAELPGGAVGELYSSAIGARDADGDPLTFAVAAGALPDGLMLNAATGAITGTPTTVGTSVFTIEVRDPDGHALTRIFAIAVTTKPEWITDGELPDGQQLQAYPALQIDAVDPDGDALSFSVDHDLLPKGMTLSSAGVLAGTPENYGRFSFDSHVSDGKGGVATQRLSLAINAVPVWQTAPQLPGALAGVAYGPVQLRASDPDDAALIYTMTAGELPAGLSFDDSTATISGTPITDASATFTVVVSDGRGGTASRTFGIGENMGPEWVTPAGDLPVAQLGEEYSTRVMASDADSLAYTMTSGGLPSGLIFDPTSGQISGFSAQGGLFPFTVEVSDGVTPAVARSFVLRVNRAPVWQTASDALPRMTVGAPYSFQLQASDADDDSLSLALLAKSELPKGLSLSRDGLISGTPINWDGRSFTVEARDGYGGLTFQSFTITGNSAPNWTSPSAGALPGATAGSSYNATFTAKDNEGDPIDITIIAGVLPNGLTLDTSVPGTATIAGTLTQSGSFTFTLRATDALGAASERSFSIAVNGKPVWITASGRLWPNAVLDEPYSVTLQADDPDANTLSYSLRIGELPDGMSLNNAGVIAGTPVESGSFAFSVIVSDPLGASEERSFELYINTPPTITTESLPPATIGVPYGATLAASDPDAGQIVTFARAAGALPSGLTMSAKGAITGVPTSASSTFEVRAFDGDNGITYKSFTIDKNEPPVWHTSSGGLPLATTGEEYAAALQASDANNQPLTFAITSGALPTGLDLDPKTGAIAGIVAAAPSTSYVFTVRVSDASGLAASRSFEIITNNKPEWITPAGALGTTNVDQPYAIQLQSRDLDAHELRYSLAGGELPPGLTLSASGLISGTATQDGTYDFNVSVTDPYDASLIQGFSIVVLAGPAWTTPAGPLAHANLGAPYAVQLIATDPEGQVTFDVASGTLPAGLTLASNGRLSGTPTEAGTYSFTIDALDSAGVASPRAFSLFVNTPPVWVSSGQLGAIIAPNKAMPPIQLVATDSDSAQTLIYAASGAPAWVSISPSGQVTGTAADSGTYSFTVKVSDGITNVSQTVAIVVNAAPTLTTANEDLPAFVLGTGYTFAFAATDANLPGQALTFSWGGTLPPGLTLDPGTGVLSGTTAESGTYVFSITVSDGLASDTKVYTADVAAGCVGTTHVFTYTGAHQTYPVPSGCTNLLVKTWGAGGGGGFGSSGGAGGYVEGTISVPEGTTMLTVIVGQGGGFAASPNPYGFGGLGGTVRGLGTSYAGGAGGGLSGVFNGTPNPSNNSNVLIVAGGGGGGGSNSNANGGQGPNQGSAGGSLQGGNSASTSNFAGGGGGGGFVGGAAGLSSSPSGTPGQGGWSKIPSGGLGMAGATATSATSAAARGVPNTSDPDYIAYESAQLGGGGLAKGAGAHGLVVIIPQP